MSSLSKSFIFSTLVALPFFSNCQTDSSSNSLEEVVIRAYEQGKTIHQLSAAINYTSPLTLKRFSPASIVMAVNTSPGVRMEERSPGSYRFNIRGSSLRSPFGVRNVKIYFNDLPFTDPGGHSYLNQLGYYDFQSLAVIKGPGSSLYGSGTGGVLLIESMTENEMPSVQLEYAGGSYNFHSIYGAVTTAGERYSSRFGFHHQQSDGYRQHSAMNKKVFSWNGRFRSGKNNLFKTSFLFGDLFYQTPGALNAAEFTTDPTLPRPGAPGMPGAVANKAAIYQKTFLAGLSYLHHITSNISNRTSLYGMFTQLRNPAIRNYGKNSEPHAGIRNVLQFSKPTSSGNFGFDLGAELQYGFPEVNVHQNNLGEPATLQSHDAMDVRQHFVFAQAKWEVRSWSLTAGGSLNGQKIELKRFLPSPGPVLNKKFPGEFAPRIALSKQFRNIMVYSSVARGFSPASSSELAPSGSPLNPDLAPEYGVNYDLGAKARFNNGFYFDINLFHFDLTNTIVQRRDSLGGEYFINSGRARQRGIETSMGYQVFRGRNYQSLIWISHTFHDFEYVSFKQVETDFSGNQMPGNPKHSLAAGIDFMPGKNFFGHLNYYYGGELPLNDANTAFASHYHLLALRMGFEKGFSDYRIRFTVGAENLLDETYSLGNDINGFGGRYYNAAPGRNFFASLMLQWNYK